MTYERKQLNNGVWVIVEQGKNWQQPEKAVSFAFDTETLTYYNGKRVKENQLFKKTKGLTTEEKRKRLSVNVWAWQVYDEVNGFFMTNDFDTLMLYCCYAGYKFGWCYNSTFDFSQIDYQLLSCEKWKPHKKAEKGKGYDKGQAFTYESVHNDMGARYAYKLWYEYRHVDRHKYVHSVEFRDFMKLVTGGLKKLLKDLDIKDNEGNPIRKLEMSYQEVNINEPTQDEIAYCCNDVKGLYFAVKKFNETIEQQSNGTCHIFGKETNLMTAGGFAKHELLRSLYPNKTNKRFRLQQYQREHPLTVEQDEYLRANHLYRGGITFVNPVYKGKLITNRLMYRYDVNSEYPYAMASIKDLIGKPFKKPYSDWLAMSQEDKDKYECVLVLKSVVGELKPNMLGVWYDPFKKSFVDFIDEEGTHLIFEREFNELLEWYDDVVYDCEQVILWKRGDYSYKPFVEKNYALKAQAKKDKNATLQQVAKLLLNSSYGKLSERLTRTLGHYELNAETNAVHFVHDEEKTEAQSMLNVAVGALITAFARTYILSKIREVCKGNVKANFVYIDTDSIHCFCDYDKADAFALGGLKLEATCQAIKYIAPKTYIDIETVNKDGTVDYEGIEVHSKGINVQAVKADLMKKQKGKRHNLPTLKLIDNKIAYGKQFICLQAMNVKGGKCLLPTLKYIARLEQAPSEDERLIFTNYEGAMFTEI